MYELFLILHFLGLALGVGTSFAFMTLGLATKDLNAEERTRFMLRASLLSKNGSIGLTLLIVSGIGFLVMRGVGDVMRWGGGAFHAKLLLVAILAGLIRSEEHTSELQSRENLVCRLLLEKKKELTVRGDRLEIA